MNDEEKKIVIFFIVSFLTANLIGYICNIDILKILIITKNGRIISFVPLCISTVGTLIYYMINKTRKK